ncbi:Xanthan lyase precursor [Rubripirellula lacrimiformis]|uniref:Xanthan lyase n=1 Tax=Rubripirellula lacrimiformis TaxID=1930273 RepID=A0A517NK59_9BACT|nr:FAD-dependent oxidoreductase [Rubripirellula lacrimiformis]QDT07527.1 Xanthan lyase precursor [Rubripirellula lacrimiformis]
MKLPELASMRMAFQQFGGPAFRPLRWAMGTWLALAILSPARADDAAQYDVVIYGGTSAAITTAVQSRQMGKSVIIVCPETHLGGLTSGGLGWTDSGNKNAIGGLSRQFYHRVWQHYQQPQNWRWESQSKFGGRNQSGPRQAGDGSTMWVFEPHVAEQIFDNWMAEHKVPVRRNQWLDRSDGGVTINNGRIESFRTTDGHVYRGKMFVDVTYEGDLMAAAGVDYHVGREASSVYDESYNGVQVGVLHHAHHFKQPVDPYVTPGDPSSGLLPLISGDPPGKRGEADDRVQAYCFRMCLTNVDDNRIPFAKPAGYDADEYALLLRVFDTGWRDMFQKFDPMPNRKTDTNNHGPVSTDYIGANYDYPEADYERRKEIIADHERYQKGLMYFMANDDRVPEDVRTAMSKWGLPKDEFPDTGGWPHQLYIREARRMIGHYVMTQQDCLDQKETPSSIGMGSYTLDSHNTQRYVKPDGFVQNEGDIGVHTPRPYRISYGSIVPKKSQCQNLLVPVCVSSSHIAFGSIRMEPVFMILGQSAATAACLSIDQDIAVQDLDYAALRDQLISDGQVLQWDRAAAPKSKRDHDSFSSRQLEGTVVDDMNAKFSGLWNQSMANQPFVDIGYHHNRAEPDADASATFTAKLAAGRYRVQLAYPVNSNRATNVPVTIKHADGETKVVVNQRTAPTVDRLFVDLGQYTFGAGGDASVRVQTAGTDGYVVVDAVRWLPVKND